MKILSASLRDLSALYKLEHTCFDHDAWSLFDLVAVLTFPDVVRFKAVVNEKMAGFVAGDPRPSQGFSWIATIGVMPEFQRRGIARALLRSCESHLKTTRVRLTVRASNQKAIALYEAEGYTTVDVWKNYYNDGENAIMMEKFLR